jgi:sugar/nucleoside kinase (ribokinase family)
MPNVGTDVAHADSLPTVFVDAVGAGDSFNAGMVYAVIGGLVARQIDATRWWCVVRCRPGLRVGRRRNPLSPTQWCFWAMWRSKSE